MTDYLSAIPLVDQLSMLIKALLVMNVLLTGGVIFFAWQATALRQRVNELEAREAEDTEVILGATSDDLSDDRPIPIIRHRFGDASGMLHRTEDLQETTREVV